MDEVKLLESIKACLALLKQEQEEAVESVRVAGDLLLLAQGRPDVNKHVLGILDELVSIQRRRIEVMEAVMTQPAIAEALDLIEKCEVIELGPVSLDDLPGVTLSPEDANRIGEAGVQSAADQVA